MNNQEEIREGILHDFLLEGYYCVTFSARIGDTEGLSFQCYPARGKALSEIHIFENYNIYKALAEA